MLAGAGVCSIIVNAVLVGWLVRWLGDRRTVRSTREVVAYAQDRMQGALTSLVSLAGIAGPLLFANAFAWFIGRSAPLPLPGAPWLLAGVSFATGWIIAWKRAGRAGVSAPAALG